MTGQLRPDAAGRYLPTLLGRQLTGEQLAAVTAPLEPQLVIAGAGSGKTMVMAARVVHAVAFHGISPSAVLGLTFTNKAARELADRVRAALTALSAAGVLDESVLLDEPPTVATYHAYAAGIVRDSALRIGREPDATLLSEAKRWQLALRVVRAERGSLPGLNLTSAFIAQYLLDLDGEMAEHLVTPEQARACNDAVLQSLADLPRNRKGGLSGELGELLASATARRSLLHLVEGYRRRKHELDLLDFGDQVALAAEIAGRCPEVGQAERGRFRLVLLDEYQDTGVGQRILLTTLFSGGHAVTAVGDPCQSIYGWRGASVGNLLRFAEHFPSSRQPAPHQPPHYLSRSFRNDHRILDVANELSQPLRSRRGTGQPVSVPPLIGTPERADAGTVLVARHLTILDEAEWVGDHLARLTAEGEVPFREIAVLCRRRADFATFHEALVRRGLPVEVVGLGGLLDLPEVTDVAAMLQVLVEPTANPALVRVLTGPRYRIGARDLSALGRRAETLLRAQGGGYGRAPSPTDDPDGTAALTAATASVDPCDVIALTDALEDPGDAGQYSPQALERFARLTAELASLRSLVVQPVVEAVSELVTAIGLDVEIEALSGPMREARAANLTAFLDHAARYEGLDGDADVPGFLAYLQAARDKEQGLEIGGISSADTIKLMTVHKAKGLEWDVVAVPGMATGSFPNTQARPVWTKAGRALPARLRGDRADLPADPELTTKALQAHNAAAKEEALTEERRLAYVAVTRARHTLLVSGHIWNRTRTRPCDVSPFLEEIRTAAAVAGRPGAVQKWQDDPGSANPLLAGEPVEVPWPPPQRPEQQAMRLAAAAAVRAASAQRIREGAGVPAQAGAGVPAGPAPNPDTPPPGMSAAEMSSSEMSSSGMSSSGMSSSGAPGEGTGATWRWEVDKVLEERRRGAHPERVVELPRTLSASQVVRLAEDPEGLARSLARPLPRRPGSAARRGTAFHAWVESLFGARPLLDDDELSGAGDELLPQDEELAALQEAFGRTPYADLVPYQVEAPFLLPLDGRLLRGRIDAVYRVDGGFDVIDWKTGLSPSNPAAAALQLAVYRVAWAAIAGVPLDQVGAAFLYVRTGEVVRPPELPDCDGLRRILRGNATAAAFADVRT
ncbi:MAG: ATP-dependent helicase [Actinomycetota bacterium]|nr:ATP-dependent helicase [Actinomycetota bacterium]